MAHTELTDTAEIDELVASLHETSGTYVLTQRVAMMLIQSNDFATLNGMPLAIALWHARSDISKENAIELLKSFNDLCVEEIEENWESLCKKRDAVLAGKFRRQTYEDLTSRLVKALASDTDEPVDGLTDRTLGELYEDIGDARFLLGVEFAPNPLGAKWTAETTVSEVIYDVDAAIEGYV